MMELKHELKVMWDMAKTAWSLLPEKAKYAIYGGGAILLLMLVMGAAKAGPATSNFGFIGLPGSNVTYACYVEDDSVPPPFGDVLTCLILEMQGPGMLVVEGSVSFCTQAADKTYSCGNYEDMLRITTGI